MDRETFKALASETRLDVLHALDERRKTGSELARELELNKATVHEHLQILHATGLVEKLDEGRKWIYWQLTWDGKKLLHPEAGTTFSVLLGLSTVAAGGGLIALGRALGWWMADAMAGSNGDDADGGDTETAFAPENDEQPEEGSDADTADTADPGRTEAAEAPVAEDESLGSDTGIDFFDDGGWFAIALLLTTALMLGLAVWLRRRS